MFVFAKTASSDLPISGSIDALKNLKKILLNVMKILE